MIFNFSFQKNNGFSLLLAVLMMALFLAIALGISTIFISQTQMLKGMGYSIVAFYAADTGIERALYEEQAVSGVLANGAAYNVQYFTPGPACPGQSYCLKSVGIYKQTRRAIEIIR